MIPARRNSPDLATAVGFLLALASIMGGLLLEGGSLADILQSTAALIVIGGTLGATFISTPLPVLKSAARRLWAVFLEPHNLEGTVDEVVLLSAKARKSGIASLEQDAAVTQDPFLQKALNLVADRMPPDEIRKIMEIDLEQEELRWATDARVFEAAGCTAPTVGIIGAVLGLIQVMKHLESIDDVGRGIAVSFVATIYGVALANLILLPCGAKLKARAAQVIQARELILEGVVGIAEAVNPTLLRLTLEPFTPPLPEMEIVRQLEQSAA